MSDRCGPEKMAAFFEDDGQHGILYISDQKAQHILRHLQIYEGADSLFIQESDVEVLWSGDGTKCGVAIWGKMRGIMDTATGGEVCAALESRESPGIVDPQWLKGFDDYLDQDRFVRARQRYWKETICEHESTARPLPEEKTPIQTNFILYARGPGKTFGVFEDDGETGYLYLYSAADETVLRFLHLYDRSPVLEVTPDNVEVMWARGETKCGVAIWGKMRGIIDLAAGKEGRVWIESKDTPGIDEAKWLDGF